MASHAHPYGNLVTNGTESFSPHPTQAHSHGHSQSIGSLAHNTSPIIETVHLYVPNAVIGAIIGTKGLFIKSIIKNSSASVKVKSEFPFNG
jgi:KH domain